MCCIISFVLKIKLFAKKNQKKRYYYHIYHPIHYVILLALAERKLELMEKCYSILWGMHHQVLRQMYIIILRNIKE